MLRIVAPALASLYKLGDWGFQGIAMNIAIEFEPVGVGIDEDGLETPTKLFPVICTSVRLKFWEYNPVI